MLAPCRRSGSRLALAAAAAALPSGCSGSVLAFGISLAPWLACVAAGAAIAYVASRVLEARVFAYDPRYFVWVFLALTTLCSIGLWYVLARPPLG